MTSHLKTRSHSFYNKNENFHKNEVQQIRQILTIYISCKYYRISCYIELEKSYQRHLDFDSITTFHKIAK